MFGRISPAFTHDRGTLGTPLAELCPQELNEGKKYLSGRGKETGSVGSGIIAGLAGVGAFAEGEVGGGAVHTVAETVGEGVQDLGADNEDED